MNTEKNTEKYLNEQNQKIIIVMGAGLSEVMPLEDHPWGDRGFSVVNPIDTSIYIYSDRTPAEEFRQFYKVE